MVQQLRSDDAENRSTDASTGVDDTGGDVPTALEVAAGERSNGVEDEALAGAEKEAFGDDEAGEAVGAEAGEEGTEGDQGGANEGDVAL